MSDQTQADSVAVGVPTFYAQAVLVQTTQYDATMTFLQYQLPPGAGAGEVDAERAPVVRVILSHRTLRELKALFDRQPLLPPEGDDE